MPAGPTDIFDDMQQVIKDDWRKTFIRKNLTEAQVKRIGDLSPFTFYRWQDWASLLWLPKILLELPFRLAFSFVSYLTSGTPLEGLLIPLRIVGELIRLIASPWELLRPSFAFISKTQVTKATSGGTLYEKKTTFTRFFEASPLLLGLVFTALVVLSIFTAGILPAALAFLVPVVSTLMAVMAPLLTTLGAQILLIAASLFAATGVPHILKRLIFESEFRNDILSGESTWDNDEKPSLVKTLLSVLPTKEPKTPTPPQAAQPDTKEPPPTPEKILLEKLLDQEYMEDSFRYGMEKAKSAKEPTSQNVKAGHYSLNLVKLAENLGQETVDQLIAGDQAAIKTLLQKEAEIPLVYRAPAATRSQEVTIQQVLKTAASTARPNETPPPKPAEENKRSEPKLPLPEANPNPVPAQSLEQKTPKQKPKRQTRIAAKSAPEKELVSDQKAGAHLIKKLLDVMKKRPAKQQSLRAEVESLHAKGKLELAKTQLLLAERQSLLEPFVYGADKAGNEPLSQNIEKGLYSIDIGSADPKEILKLLTSSTEIPLLYRERLGDDKPQKLTINLSETLNALAKRDPEKAQKGDFTVPVESVTKPDSGLGHSSS